VEKLPARLKRVSASKFRCAARAKKFCSGALHDKNKASILAKTAQPAGLTIPYFGLRERQFLNRSSGFLPV
jgi:hypothetical protein